MLSRHASTAFVVRPNAMYDSADMFKWGVDENWVKAAAIAALQTERAASTQLLGRLFRTISKTVLALLREHTYN